ncbi:MAG: polysaccharide biosynthesis tyrosine autokinase [Gemmatimonadetes bacterium]|uniref:Polysaccharide biosynthesis tyrosine autokinase n=1 Tax=Candidatus Kutchimonas denitrificans TaxID=3056748 RepID=A0AAE5CC28_9BACT|nr:polysaccharide biosynthesis tyrosine autokinase [Gemmatimonadota bacterium]NIR75150.1 polysaccharide biosynthesis tyrosine autokinase [Candidatus Kutchimonas denitrificans]NIU52960.1 polysaccharide biosynthesis tyrosine autokinase [Gemmatimonadota bacterium]
MSNNLPSPGPFDGRQPLPEVQRTDHVNGHEFDPFGGGGELNWRRYIAVLFRYKWLVLASLVLGVAAGVGLSRFVPTLYQAEATIWVEGGAGGEAGAGPIRPSQLLRAQAWIDLLKSYLVLDHVVREQRLYISVEAPDGGKLGTSLDTKERFTPGEYKLMVEEDGRTFQLRQDDVVLQRGALGDSIGPELGLAWVIAPEEVEPGQEIRVTIGNPRDVATALAERLRIEMERNGTFLRLSLQDRNPKRVAAVLNALSERYVSVAAELKSERVRELTKILDEQLDFALHNLQEAEADLEGFRVATITLPSEPASPVNPGLESTRDPAMGSFFDLKIRREQLRQDREAIERVLAMAPDSSLVVEALEVIPPVREASELTGALEELTAKRADLRALRQRYTDAYRPVRALADEVEVLEQQTVPRLARALVRELEAREAELDRQIASASGELQGIPPRAIEEARLERRVETAEALYVNLQKRYEEARLAAASTIPDVRILDAAVMPREPVSDTRRLRFIFLVVVAVSGVGLAGAIVLDRIDPRFRYPEQVSEELGVPILGAVPFVRERRGQMSKADADQVVEAFRNIRLALSHAYGAAGPVVATITSPGSRDGKSFVSSNLALSFADLGRRALLIDADTRRGALHRRLSGVRRPGLTDYLSGSAPRGKIIQQAVHGSVDLISSGTRFRNGPELLQSERMTGLLARLRADYDVILIDSPPLGAGIDPFVVGTATGNLLLVLRTGESNRALLHAKLEMLDVLPIRLLGAVLNAVSSEGIGRYYSYYQYYSYMPGYEAYDEDPTAAGRLIGGSDPAGTDPEAEVFPEREYPTDRDEIESEAPRPADRNGPEQEAQGPPDRDAPARPEADPLPRKGGAGGVASGSHGTATPGGAAHGRASPSTKPRGAGAASPQAGSNLRPGTESPRNTTARSRTDIVAGGGAAPRPARDAAPKRQSHVHRQHQRRNQTRQWR